MTTRWARRAMHVSRFALVGVALFLATRMLEDGAAASPELVVHVRAQASPLDVERAIDEAVLVETALASDLPWSDPYVRARVVADLRAGDPRAEASDEDLVERARGLGLVRAHPVLRARVAAAMQRRIEANLRVEAADEQALLSYLDAHPERYARAPQIDFVHVFVSAARHGADVDTAAAALAEQLVGTTVDVGAGLGDPSLLPREMSAATPAKIDAAFGPDMGRAIVEADPDRWVGPLRSAYGRHFVFVRGRRAGGTPSLGTVIDRVRLDWTQDRRRTESTRALRAMREAWTISVQRPEAST